METKLDPSIVGDEPWISIINRATTVVTITRKQ